MTEAQHLAADPRASAFVRANAGSGKTETLISRTARLLLARVDPAAILCVTYTKAAAAEMQRRLFRRLGDWAVAKDAALRQTLAELEGGAPDSFSPQDLRTARTLFAAALLLSGLNPAGAQDPAAAPGNAGPPPPKSHPPLPP